MTTEATEPELRQEPPEPAIWEDYVDIFYAPRDVFARRGKNRWMLSLAVLTVVLGILVFAMNELYAPVYQAMIADAVRENAPAGLTAEEMANYRNIAMMSATIGSIVSFPLMTIVLGFGIWLVGKTFGSIEPLSGGLLIAVYSQFPRLIQTAIMLVQGLIIDVDRMDSMAEAALSPARFFPGEPSDLLTGAMERFNPFTLWCTVLIGIGLMVRGRLGRTEAALAATVIWLLALFPVALALVR